MKTLAVANQKSVGKSTIVYHLATMAADAGLRVLIVSMDGQGSLEMVLPQSADGQAYTTASDLFKEEAPSLPLEYLTETVAFIRAKKDMLSLDALGEDLVKRPKQHLRKLASNFDVCFIDTPGRICMPLTASLAAADVVLCPTSLGLFELGALADLWHFIHAVKKNGHNPHLRLMGILPSKINTKSREELEGLDNLRKQFGPALMPLMLAENTAVKQSQSRRRPVWLATKGAGHRKAAVEWKFVCNSVLVNLGVMK
jgi:chromosome partitioning protein